MNLTRIFETQDILDKRIVKEKGLEGQNLLPEKILALQVELGELANEWRGFKFWANDQEPRIEKEIRCFSCQGTGDENYETVQEDAEGRGGHVYVDCVDCDTTGVSEVTNPLLEEYVDCLHFILSIGNYLNIEKFKSKNLISFNNNITGQFNSLFYLISRCDAVALLIDDTDWRVVINNFLHLGEMLGFTWEQIEQAYYAKNKINHERQATGY